MNDELGNCPFCKTDGAPTRRIGDYDHYRIECVECYRAKTPWFDTIAEAVAYWNCFSNLMEDRFIKAFWTMQREIHANAKAHGWHDEDRNDAECMMLITCELAEATEELRKGNPPDSHIPEFSGLEIELADVAIRLLDYAELRSLRLAEAIIAKHEYNKTRPHRHGGKRF